jgi:hypothetical protein
VAPDPLIRRRLVEPGERRAVARLPARPGFSRIFYHPDLALPAFDGIEQIPLPADPTAARWFLQEMILRTDAKSAA